ncbi:MAG: hypothetical protein KDA61_10670, partial [Planctomycetales bacterium]|nr:hypothetical protein [Planctomycetales bacterium]
LALQRDFGATAVDRDVRLWEATFGHAVPEGNAETATAFDAAMALYAQEFDGGSANRSSFGRMPARRRDVWLPAN